AMLVASYAAVGAYVLHLRLTPQQRVAWFDAALAACRRLGDRLGEGKALGNLGLAWAALGDAKKAIGYHEQQLAIALEIGDRHSEGAALYNSAEEYEKLGEHNKAIANAKAALATLRAIESPHVATVETWLRARDI